MLDQAFRRNVSAVLILGLVLVTGVFYTMATSAEALEDGVFQGSAEGYKSEITVEVTVADGRITQITVVEHDETAAIADPAFSQLAETVLAAQSIEVEAVSGATYSSDAFLQAIARALGIMNLEDGVYQGTAEGFQSDVTVEVTVADGRISQIVVSDHGETPSIADPAFETLQAAVLQAQSLNVDVVSGATYSSDAFLEAAAKALGL